MVKKCPLCKGRGKVMEMRGYAGPMLGQEMFVAAKRAWPVRDRESFKVVRVKSIRACCRCGGRGEIRSG